MYLWYVRISKRSLTNRDVRKVSKKIKQLEMQMMVRGIGSAEEPYKEKKFNGVLKTRI